MERDDLERGIHRLCADVALGPRARSRLIHGLAGEHAERDRDVEPRPQIGERACDRVGENVEMRRLAADQAAERDHRVVPSGARYRRHGLRELERTCHLELFDLGPRGQRAAQRPLRQGAGDLVVPARSDDRHPGSDKRVSHSGWRLPTLGHLTQSSPRMATSLVNG
jgi:hypothetical protein